MAMSTEIYNLSLQCDESFRRVTRDHTTRCYAVVEVLYQRFSQWANHLGAFAHESISLDTRLIYSDSLRGLVIQFLEIARRNLDRIERLENKGIVNETPNFIIDQMGETTRKKVSSLLVESLQALESAVDGLHRLGTAIRQSSSGNLTQRIQSFIGRKDDGVLEAMVYLHIKHRLVDQVRAEQAIAVQSRRAKDKETNENGDDKITGAALSLCRQLAVSVSFRYFGILYRRSHEKKLGEKRQTKPETDKDEKQALPSLIPNAAVHRINRVSARDEEPKKTPQYPVYAKVAPSESRPSIPDSKVVRQRYASSQRSFTRAASVISIRPKDVKYPDPPEVVHPARDATCPYCCQLYPKIKYDDNHWWRRHVEDDLKLYACISEDCIEPPQLFARFEEWKKHMETKHSSGWVQKVHMPVNWICEMSDGKGNCEVWFNDETKFEEHVKKEHPRYAEGSRLAAFKEWCEVRQTRPPHTCPICNCIPEKLAPIASQIDPNMQGASIRGPHQGTTKARDIADAQEELLRHAASHLKQIGFLSIAYLDNNDEDESRVSRNASDGERENLIGLPPGTWVNGEWLPTEAESVFYLDLEYRDDYLAPAPELLHTDVNWGDFEPNWDYANSHLGTSKISNKIEPNWGESEAFRDQLSDAMIWSHYDKRDFLPAGSLAQILSVRAVASRLHLEQSDELLTFIIQDAIKVFATVIRSARQTEKALRDVMDSFRLHGFTDSLLPIDDFRCMFRKNCDQCHHSDRLNVFHGHNWGKASIKDFYNEQWAFLAPVFTKDNLIHKLEPLHILPIKWVDDTSNMRLSGFSEVRKVMFHPDHLTMAENEPGALNVALKKLKPQSSESGTSVDRQWQAEVEALEAANISRNPHLNTCLGAFSRDGEHFFVLQWADEGNLKEFWMNNPTPSLDEGFVRNVLGELLGLAKALQALHNPGSPARLESKSKVPGNWRHGDLKPENILVRRRPVGSREKLGTLQIADFGLAKRHSNDTEERAMWTSQIYATIMYGPPEAQFPEEHPRSRVYDIWSMGCIVLEFMIWLLWGTDGWSTFTHERFALNSKDTLFYTIEGYRKAKVSDVATYWMGLIQDDPECNEQPHTALRDLLQLVKERLLVVAIGHDGTGRGECRATASILCQELQRIIDRADRDSTYILKVRNRMDIPTPIGLRSKHLAPPKGPAPNFPHPSQEATQVVDIKIPVPDAKVVLILNSLFLPIGIYAHLYEIRTQVIAEYNT